MWPFIDFVKYSSFSTINRDIPELINDYKSLVRTSLSAIHLSSKA